MSDTLDTDATMVDGRAFALNGAVTLHDNTIWSHRKYGTAADSITALTAPEPSTWAMMLIGFCGLGFAGARRTKLRDARSIICE